MKNEISILKSGGEIKVTEKNYISVLNYFQSIGRELIIVSKEKSTLTIKLTN
jgi:hypothetical protein